MRASNSSISARENERVACWQNEGSPQTHDFQLRESQDLEGGSDRRLVASGGSCWQGRRVGRARGFEPPTHSLRRYPSVALTGYGRSPYDSCTPRFLRASHPPGSGGVPLVPNAFRYSPLTVAPPMRAAGLPFPGGGALQAAQNRISITVSQSLTWNR